MKERTVAPGEHLVQELQWIHGILRQDLATIRELAAQAAGGASAVHITTTIRSLQTQSPLWQLRVNCLQYCQFVHHHHGLESAMLFPALRQADPSLARTVDRLESDHRKVSDLLDTVEAIAGLLGTDQDADARRRLAGALNELGAHLLEHLDFEERSISPTLRSWRRWPWE
ncbi:hypothetical protein Pth03_69870 [Planotetraspora thailandica]|uniref:Hemerythrin-like domain-containing protein n=1 Tax=Planotetraspora thailandica TaxID=487172 RepID=A0A8J3Y0H9_9ACTN|nr:hemerythrin domain-containing protein [Planotetraspora thailandica]GII58598.1 hypothetical protein Pth03_69870 [Planotetraspora thailandica]